MRLELLYIRSQVDVHTVKVPLGGGTQNASPRLHLKRKWLRQIWGWALTNVRYDKVEPFVPWQ